MQGVKKDKQHFLQAESKLQPESDTIHSIVPVDRNTTGYLLWCDSGSEASHTCVVAVLSTVHAVKPSGHRPEGLLLRP